MFSRLATSFTVLAVAVAAFAQGITPNTPLSVVVCQPVQLSWVGGTPPYFVSLLPFPVQQNAAAVVDFGRVTETSLSWTANLAVGTNVFLQVRDTNGVIGQSAQFTILTGSDTECVGQDPTSSGDSTGTTTPTGTGTTPPATTGTTTTPRPTNSNTTPTNSNSNTASNTDSADNAEETGNGENSASRFASSGVLALAGVAAVAALL